MRKLLLVAVSVIGFTSVQAQAQEVTPALMQFVTRIAPLIVGNKCGSIDAANFKTILTAYIDDALKHGMSQQQVLGAFRGSANAVNPATITVVECAQSKVMVANEIANIATSYLPE